MQYDFNYSPLPITQGDSLEFKFGGVGGVGIFTVIRFLDSVGRFPMCSSIFGRRTSATFSSIRRFALKQLPLGPKRPFSIATMWFARPLPRRATQIYLTNTDIRVASPMEPPSPPTKLVIDFSTLLKKHQFASSGHPFIFKFHYAPASGLGQRRIPIPFSALVTTSDTRDGWADMKAEITLFERRAGGTANEAVRRELLLVCFRACRCLVSEGYLVAMKLPLLLGGNVVDLTNMDEKAFTKMVLDHTPMSGTAATTPTLVRKIPDLELAETATVNGNGTHGGDGGDLVMGDL